MSFIRPDRVATILAVYDADIACVEARAVRLRAERADFLATVEAASTRVTAQRYLDDAASAAAVAPPPAAPMDTVAHPGDVPASAVAHTTPAPGVYAYRTFIGDVAHPVVSFGTPQTIPLAVARLRYELVPPPPTGFGLGRRTADTGLYGVPPATLSSSDHSPSMPLCLAAAMEEADAPFTGVRRPRTDSDAGTDPARATMVRRAIAATTGDGVGVTMARPGGPM